MSRPRFLGRRWKCAPDYRDQTTCVAALYSYPQTDGRRIVLAYVKKGSVWDPSIIQHDIDCLFLYPVYTQIIFDWEEQAGSISGTLRFGGSVCEGVADNGTKQMRRIELLSCLPAKFTFDLGLTDESAKHGVSFQLMNTMGEILLTVTESITLKFFQSPHSTETAKTAEENDDPAVALTNERTDGRTDR